MTNADHSRSSSALRVVGLFAGIGGIELGLHGAGHQSELLCEVMPEAQRVLTARFPDVPLHGDVRTLTGPPPADVLAAGFPCQDLSQAGRTAGIGGRNSGLVHHVFRLLDCHEPRWLLLENVPFMLQLERGRAMTYLTESLGERGYRWAYRVVDARAFGPPQRRQRVLLLASRLCDRPSRTSSAPFCPLPTVGSTEPRSSWTRTRSCCQSPTSLCDAAPSACSSATRNTRKRPTGRLATCTSSWPIVSPPVLSKAFSCTRRNRAAPAFTGSCEAGRVCS